MKNHEWIDGKLLQMNKKYSHLKQKQKEKIYQWMYEAYLDKYKDKGTFPSEKDDEEIVGRVLRRIESAEIWIPAGEVYKHYRSIRKNLRKRLAKANNKSCVLGLEIEPLDIVFSVCKVKDYSGVDVEHPYCFIGSTDVEKSLVCPIDLVPENVIDRDDGWKAFRIAGNLDFSLIGILARITKIMAGNEIGVFAISTFNTDYVLTKEKDFNRALKALQGAGYSVLERADGVEAEDV